MTRTTEPRRYWAVCHDCQISITLEVTPEHPSGPLPLEEDWDDEACGTICPICGMNLSWEGSDPETSWEQWLRVDTGRQIMGMNLVTDPNLPRSTAYVVTNPNPHVPRTMMDCAECHIVYVADELVRTSSGEYVCTGCDHEDRYPR